MIKFVAAVSLLTLAGAFPHSPDIEGSNSGKCGYDSCPIPKAGMINVHLVPHSHDDVGWLKTVDQYYFGSRTSIQNAGVQYILDSVVNALLHDPKKKFIYVETAFFWKWWKEQEDHMRHRVKQLVKNGQLEFIGGGWSMNDEATTHYQSVIDQFTWGFRKLNETFGTCGRPKIGWQIDPFGHSRETASMMAHFGFDGLFFGRLDYQDKINRLESTSMEMIWEGNPILGYQANIFTGALYNLYQAPRGFCFDIMCGDEPIIDDAHSPDYNVDRRVNKFLDYIHWQNVNYRGNEIMMTMGGDFNYQDAHYYFKNLDKLIRYVNKLQENGSKVNVFYSTPSCYLKSLNDANLTWPTKQDDFFPYASDPHAYWTGYYTSRPTLKYYERQGNNMLQICKQLSSLALLGPEDVPDIDSLREAMGVMQHHDAITGTEKQHVADDYARILTDGLKKCGRVSSVGLNKLMSKGDSSVPSLAFNSCPLANISECKISSESPKFVATVYNPLSRPVDFYVRLPVSARSFSVKNPKGAEVPNQVVPIPKSLFDMPGRTATTTLELVFKAEKVPPLGFRSYYVSAVAANGIDPEPEFVDGLDEFLIGDDVMKITLNGSTGLLSSVGIEGKTIPLTQNFEYYVGEVGNNEVFDNRSSGAYIFRPKMQNSLKIAETVNVTVHKGPLVTEVHQVFASWASQVIRQYAGESCAEAEWLIGPIPISDGEGKEVITRYSTQIDSKGVFYTDSNGRQTIQRKRHFRPTWKLDLKEPVAGNYYPVTTDISIKDSELELSVLVDRAEGGSSLKDGDIELMLHRRLLHDDAFGVDEALNEEAYGKGLIARGRHWILLGNSSNQDWHRQKQLLLQEKVLSSQVVLTDSTSLDFNSWATNYRLEYSGLTESLPPAVQILTLEPWKKNILLLRLEHVLETNEVVDVDLSKLFSAFEIINARETSLGGDRLLDEMTRLKWRKESNEILVGVNEGNSVKINFPTVRLSSKQIKTFLCEIRPKNSILI